MEVPKQSLEPNSTHTTEEDLFDFDSGVYLFFMGIPIRFLKKTKLAKEKLLEYMKTMNEEETTRFIKLLVQDTNDKHLKAIQYLDVLMASQTNSVRGAFWGLYNMLKNPEVLKEASKEVESLDMANYEESMEKMKYLHACFTETTRFQNSSVSVRQAVENTSLTIKTLGQFVTLLQ
jgi:cytochrome P450